MTFEITKSLIESDLFFILRHIEKSDPGSPLLWAKMQTL